MVIPLLSSLHDNSVENTYLRCIKHLNRGFPPQMAQGRPGTDSLIFRQELTFQLELSEVADTLQIWEGITLPQKD